MQSEIAQPRPNDMGMACRALLGMLELTLSFTTIYLVICTAGVADWFPALLKYLSPADFEIAGLLTLTLGAIALTIGLYRSDVCSNRTRLLTAALISMAVGFTVLLLLTGGLTRGINASKTVTVAQVIGAWMLSIGLIRLAFAFSPATLRIRSRRVLVLGEDATISGLCHRLGSRRGQRFEPVLMHRQDLSWPLLREHRIWGVVVASPVGDGDMGPLLDCKLRGVPVLDGPAFHERHLGRIDLDQLTQDDLLTADGFSAGVMSDSLKRASDLIISAAMIVLILPLMVLIALAIKADSRGPVLYRQSRVGAMGRTFTVYKFRSMSADAEACGKPRWAQKHDPRVTRVGRFIRATRIDELPQLANIIRGDMSLVGPRPERPLFVEQLSRDIPFYRDRSYVRPGLTGWAQVNYPYGASVEDAREKLAYDLYYVKHRSFWLDLRILLATVRVVLFREGAR